MKQCYLVVGPESSGNRLLAGVLIRAGCVGDATTAQRWDKTLPETETPAVVIRSYPHGDIWPDLREIAAILQERGYKVTVLITVRNPVAVISSQVKRRRAKTARDSESAIRKAYKMIMEQVGGLEFHMIPYETIIHGGDDALKGILRTLNLPPNVSGPVIVDGHARTITDQNQKHFR